MKNDPVRIDARGMRCPWPALRAARAMREAGAVTVLADDPAAAKELEALALSAGWRFSREAGEGAACFALERSDR
ncbi:MAG: redox protein [Sphingobium sp.]|nr:MAG: redox protein [Sphingobium sp.]